MNRSCGARAAERQIVRQTLMDIPKDWLDYGCGDYFESTFSTSGWWDEAAQFWYIRRAEDLREDVAREFLVIGGPGVDGIEWGYRKGRSGIWAYYPIDSEFVWLANSAQDLQEGYSAGEIKV